MWPNTQETADLVRFTEEVLNGKLHFLCSDSVRKRCTVKNLHCKNNANLNLEWFLKIFNTWKCSPKFANNKQSSKPCSEPSQIIKLEFFVKSPIVDVSDGSTMVLWSSQFKKVKSSWGKTPKTMCLKLKKKLKKRLKLSLYIAASMVLAFLETPWPFKGWFWWWSF